MMDYRPSKRQQDWFLASERTQEEKIRFLARGPAETYQTFDGKKPGPMADLRHAPIVRGLCAGQSCATGAEAQQAADAMLADFRLRAGELGGYLNEADLGIEDRHQPVERLAEDNHFRFGRIVYLAALLPNSSDCAFDQLESFFEWLGDSPDSDPIWQHLPQSVARLIADEKEDYELSEEFCQLCFDANLAGFFVRVELPMARYDSSLTSFSASWGSYVTTWVYAETMMEAAEAAAAWSVKQHERWKCKAAGAAA